MADRCSLNRKHTQERQVIAERLNELFALFSIMKEV